jgi:hypothetical protein
MRSGLRHKTYGTPIEEWIARVPNELPIDAVGLWQIVAAGRQGFGLSGQELIEFVRLILLALFEKGAKPVTGAIDGIHVWALIPYGLTPDEMADAIIGEWTSTARDPDLGGVWFAIPQIYEAKRLIRAIVNPDLIVDVTLYSMTEGGRHHPIVGEWFGCPCKLRKDDFDARDCRLLLNGQPMSPGETRRLGIKFLSDDSAPIFRDAGRFYLWEGKIIGEAVVVPNAA